MPRTVARGAGAASHFSRPEALNSPTASEAFAMATSTLLIVADRGNFKAFEVRLTLNRGSALHLLEAFAIPEAHGRFKDKYTDDAGSFPNTGTLGQGNSTAERQKLLAETETRIFRNLAGRISELLRQHHPERWHFAAPSEINGAILDGLEPGLRAHLGQNVKSDLIHTPTADLLEHFEKPLR